MAVKFVHNMVTCLSGDVKPTSDPAPGYGFQAGYRLYETDTNKTYFWSGSQWNEMVTGGASFSPTLAKTTVNLAKNSSVLSSIPGLAFTLTSGRYYTFEYRLIITSDTTTVGVGLSLQTGAVNSSVNPFVAVGNMVVAAAGVGGEYQGAILASNSTLFKTAQFNPGTSLQPMLATITGSVVSSAATTLDVMIATETGTTTVGCLKGSVGFLWDCGTS